MWRTISIVALVSLMMGSNPAIAGESKETRVPISVKAPGHKVIVDSGDHLWKISATHLAGTDRRVGPYWLEVIDLNTPQLRSGDPDLIYPGEIIELP